MKKGIACISSTKKTLHYASESPVQYLFKTGRLDWIISLLGTICSQARNRQMLPWIYLQLILDYMQSSKESPNASLDYIQSSKQSPNASLDLPAVDMKLVVKRY